MYLNLKIITTEGGELEAKALLDAIEARNTFAIFATAFRQRDWDVIGQGWSGTRTKLEARLADAETGEFSVVDLEQIYRDNLLYAQKAVSLWSVDPEVAQRVVAVLPDMIDPESPYLRTYPLPLPEDALMRGVPQCVPTAVHQVDGRSVLVLGSKRSTTKEVPVPVEQIPQSLIAEGYTELIAKMRSVSAAFDSIAIDPMSGLVEMRIDQARASSEKELIQYREKLRSRFNDLVRTRLGVFPLLNQTPANLFSALVRLYRGQDWSVQRLGHVNEGGYINSNRGRHRTDDIRNDDYHRAGEGAVDSLQVWSLTAVFNSQEGYGKPMLELEGHSKLLSLQQPHLDLARVLDCAGPEDYFLVLNTLLECLSGQTESQPVADDELDQQVLLTESQ